MSATLDRTWPANGSSKARLAAAMAAAAILSLMDIFPDVDLEFSGRFYRPGLGFPLAHLGLFGFVMEALPILAIGAAAAVAAIGLVNLVTGHRRWGITARHSLYIVASLAIGPGLLVNSVLKDNWGRARPHQIVEFGGSAHFTPVLQLADQCTRNCSFPSGHGALGFWTLAFVALVPARWRLPAIFVGLTIGAMVGLMRIVQGAHFLSDVLGAAILVVGVNFTLKYLILGPTDNRG